jgi:hypothetical protein
MLRTLLPLACVIAAATAHADPADTATYAVVVGSNAGGPGQTDLRYAEDDARRVGDLLVELGGYTRDRVQVVLHPSPDQLRDVLGQLGERVRADAVAGRQSRVFFYYSGHARSSAIDLGSAELPLAELRGKLFELQATLTVVVLDACQSGAFSRIKGAAPAADFSINSRQHLDASGVAVLASSSGSELSQESEQLRSSYFTHHLLVGLRGAGDANGDGQVSLDEAYRYAYHQTLLATAETAVGGQHVSFEADLKGHGEVPLSFPRAATTAIELPAAVEGQAIVEDRRAHTVVAETYKARGAPVRIAVAPGDYEVVIRHGTTLSRCELSTPATIDLGRCTSEPIRPTSTKGGGFEHPYRVELGGFAGNERSDAYTNNLNAFGYSSDALVGPFDAGYSLVGVRQVHRWFWVGATATDTAMPRYSKTIAGSDIKQSLDWSTYTIGGVVRAETPHAATTSGDLLDRLASLTSAYVQVSLGLGIGRTHLHAADAMTYDDTSFGPALGFAAGLHVNWIWWPQLGASIGYGYDYDPVITDLIGNTHATGGHRGTFALTYQF